MDPDQVLKNAREAMARVYEPYSSEAASLALAYAFEALDGWLSKGGFLPRAWER